jgi:hypothetical protein
MLRLLRFWRWWGCQCSAHSVHRKSGPTNAPVGPSYTRVLTLTVPPGRYAVFGKTEIQTSTQSGSDCVLVYDNGGGAVNPDETTKTPGTDSVSGASFAVHNLEAIIETPSSAATIWIEARAGTSWGAVDSKLIAIEVATVTDQEVTG